MAIDPRRARGLRLSPTKKNPPDQEGPRAWGTKGGGGSRRSMNYTPKISGRFFCKRLGVSKVVWDDGAVLEPRAGAV
jgi:hypothetical protein